MKRPVNRRNDGPLASAPPKPAEREPPSSISLLLLRHLQLLFNFFPIIALVPQPFSLRIRQKFIGIIYFLELLLGLFLLLLPFAGDAVGVPPHGRFFVRFFYGGLL